MPPARLGHRAALAGAAFLAAVAGAKAAELPTTRSAQQKHVKTCTVSGMTGYVLPGSTFCVKVGGYISSEVGVGNVK